MVEARVGELVVACVQEELEVELMVRPRGQLYYFVVVLSLLPELQGLQRDYLVWIEAAPVLEEVDLQPSLTLVHLLP